MIFSLSARLSILALLLFLATGVTAFAQSSASSPTFYRSAEQPFSQTGGTRPNNAGNPGPLHRSAFGKPCLSSKTNVRALTTNPTMMQHFVDVDNICPRTIRMEICYAKSRHCVDAEVHGHDSRSIFLGLAPNQNSFVFTLTEKL